MGTYDTHGGSARHDPSADCDPTTELQEKVLGILEEAGVDTAVNDRIVEMIFRWERGLPALSQPSAEGDAADLMKRAVAVPEQIAKAIGALPGSSIHAALADVELQLRKLALQPAAPVATPDLLAEVREALEECRSTLLNSGAESGYCMCGDPVKGHTIGSGHSPVDAHVYYATRLAEKIEALLSRLDHGGRDAG